MVSHPWIVTSSGLVGLAIALGPGCRTTDSTRAASSAPHRLTVGVAAPSDGRDDAPPGIGIGVIGTRLSGASLVRIDRTGRPQPGLAERWTESPDGTRWEFELVPDLTLHDGRRLTAAALRARLEESLGSPGSLLDELSIRAIEAESETRLAIELAAPSAFLLEVLQLSPISDRADGAEGAGPYHLVSTEPERIHLTAFDGYYRGRPAIGEIEIRAYPAARTAWAAMMRGDVDLLYDVPPEALEFVQASSDAEIFPFLRPFTFLVTLNLDRPALGDPGVRQALNLAIDRDALVEAVFRGRGRPAYDPVWPRFWAYDARLPRLDYAPEEAERLLDAAGLPRPAHAGPGADADGPASRLRFTCLVLAGVPRYEQLAMAVQRQLYDVGVDMRLEPVTLGEFVTRMRRREFDALLLDLVAGLGMTVPYQAWHSGGGPDLYPVTGYRAADPVLERARAARNDDEMRTAVAEFQRLIRADPPAIFLAWGETVRAVRRGFEIPAEPDGDILTSVPRWGLQGPSPAP